MSFYDRMVEWMHSPLRHSPAPKLRAFLGALARGLHGVQLRFATLSMYLDESISTWTDFHADLYVYERLPLETDAQLKMRIKNQTILERRKTTKPAIIAALEQAGGITGITLEWGTDHVYWMDEQERMAPELSSLQARAWEHGLDYSFIDDIGHEVFYNIPESSRSWMGLGPDSPARGVGGILVRVPMVYTNTLEDTLIARLIEHIPSMAGYEFSWPVDHVFVLVEDINNFEEAFSGPTGWGVDHWGQSTWG